MDPNTVTGYIEEIVYHNEDNGYTVLELNSDNDILTVVGYFGDVNEGESLVCHGTFVNHHIYGEQFSCQSYEVTEPRDLVAIARYLGSGAIKGIGPSLAARIVEQFGDDTMRVIDEEPERLAGIRGISAKGAAEIAAQVAGKRELREAMVYLQQYGISLNLSIKIYETYKGEVYKVLEENPYRLADDISGVGFKIADEIAAKIGYKPDCDYRIKSGIYYTLLLAVSEGHVFLPKDMLISSASALLNIEDVDFSDYISMLSIEKKVIIKEINGEEVVYAAPYYYMELNTAKTLYDLDESYAYDEQEIDKVLKDINANEGTIPDEDQRQAVISAISNGVSIITGGPGTGKTTTINAIIRIFEQEGLTVMLCAPTGRAAKRMTEATGYEAKTIHRLLEYSGIPDKANGKVRFDRNELNPLECDAIIVDEMSMVDIFIMSSLLRAIPKGARIVMVGDANQLPSVGAGNVLKDLISSGEFKTVNLSRIFRQQGVSDIVINAHRINEGVTIDPDEKSKDFIFVKRDDVGRIIGSMVTLVNSKLPEYVGVSPMDIQVLTPMRKGPLGVINLNLVLQKALNPPRKDANEREFPQGIFREGDKVMQRKNDYDVCWSIKNDKGFVLEEGKGIFNGDIGIVKKINTFAETMTVRFDDNKEVEFPFASTGDLELAYAVTVHKSQGSEYPAVVIPLLSGPKQLMNRNLLYTGVTRAKSCVCIVGSPECFNNMIENDEELKRYSGLACCIREISTWRKSLN